MTRGGGGSRQTVTNGDKGGGGPKIGIFTVTYFLNGPQVIICYLDFIVRLTSHVQTLMLDLVSTKEVLLRLVRRSNSFVPGLHCTGYWLRI